VVAALTILFSRCGWDVNRTTAFLEKRIATLGRFLPERRPNDPSVPVALSTVKNHRGKTSPLTVWAKLEFLVRLMREVEKRDVRDLQWMVLKSHKDAAGVYLVSFSWDIGGEREIFKWKVNVKTGAVSPYNDRTRWLDNIGEDFFARFLTKAKGVVFRTEKVKSVSRPAGGLGALSTAPDPMRPKRISTDSPSKPKSGFVELRPVRAEDSQHATAPAPGQHLQQSAQPRDPSNNLRNGASYDSPASSGVDFFLQGVMVVGSEYVGLLRSGGSTLIIYPGKLIGHGVIVRRIHRDGVVIVRNGQEESLAISAPHRATADSYAPPREPTRRRITLTPIPEGPIGDQESVEPGYRPVYREQDNRPPSLPEIPRTARPLRPRAASTSHPLSGKKKPSSDVESPEPVKHSPRPWDPSGLDEKSPHTGEPQQPDGKSGTPGGTPSDAKTPAKGAPRQDKTPSGEAAPLSPSPAKPAPSPSRPRESGDTDRIPPPEDEPTPRTPRR
jgi:hypothetical protein